MMKKLLFKYFLEGNCFIGAHFESITQQSIEATKKIFAHFRYA